MGWSGLVDRSRQLAAVAAISACVMGAAVPAQAQTATVDPVGPLLAGADLEAGQRESRKCMACHTFDEGGANRVGPNLWGIVGAPKASHEGFNYSDAFKALTGNWDYESINALIVNPREAVPGTRMVFVGLKDAQARANLIVWLRTLSADPVPLP